MNFFNTYNMCMQERGKTKPQKQKHFPPEEKLKKQKNT